MGCLLLGMIEGLYQTEPRQIAAALLDRGMLKHQAFASNIANVETPGYKRVDLNPRFEGALNEILNSGDLGQLKSFSHGLGGGHEECCREARWQQREDRVGAAGYEPQCDGIRVPEQVHGEVSGSHQDGDHGKCVHSTVIILET
jgi:hypothetical protein